MVGGCTTPADGEAPGDEDVSVDGIVRADVVPAVGATPRFHGETPKDESPRLIVGVAASAPTAEVAGLASPPRSANAAAAAPSITAERMMYFLLENFFFRTML